MIDSLSLLTKKSQNSKTIKIKSVFLLNNILKMNKLKKTRSFYFFFLREFYKIKYWQSFEDHICDQTKPLLLTHMVRLMRNSYISVLIKTFENVNKTSFLALALKRYKLRNFKLKDNFEYFFTISNSYRNYFIQLSFNERFVNLYNKKRKFFSPILKIQDLRRFSLFFKNNNLNQEFYFFFENLLNHFYILLITVLFNNKNFSYQQMNYVKNENKQFLKSGGILANLYNDKRFFKKKNSPSFIYLYMISFLNLLKAKLLKYNTKMSVNEIFLNIILKNYNKIYSNPFKNVIKNFERMNRLKTEKFYYLNQNSLKRFLGQNSLKIRKNAYLKIEKKKEVFDFSGSYKRKRLEISSALLNPGIFKTLFTIKEPILKNIKLKYPTKNFLITKKIKQIKMFKKYFRYLKKFKYLTTKRLKKKKFKERILIKYNLFDIMSFPHNGTRIQAIARK